MNDERCGSSVRRNGHTFAGLPGPLPPGERCCGRAGRTGGRWRAVRFHVRGAGLFRRAAAWPRARRSAAGAADAARTSALLLVAAARSRCRCCFFSPGWTRRATTLHHHQPPRGAAHRRAVPMHRQPAVRRIDGSVRALNGADGSGDIALRPAAAQAPGLSGAVAACPRRALAVPSRCCARCRMRPGGAAYLARGDGPG